MTPAEHYAEAERLLRALRDQLQKLDQVGTTAIIASAQVHATLATVPWAVYAQASEQASEATL